MAKRNTGAGNAPRTRRSAGAENTGAGNVENSKAKVYVWLKTKAYIDETKRVDAGLYFISNVPSRLKALGSEHCEVFEDGISGIALSKIARRAGINPDGKKEDELLEKLVKTELKPF